MVNLIALAIPLFFVGMGIEGLVARRRGVSIYRLGDSLSDMGCGITQQLVTAFWAAALLVVYETVYQHARLVTLPGWAGWVLAFLGVEVAYYWWHRLSHEVNFLWAAHVVHHHSEDFNLSVALRQSVLTSLSSFPFYLVLAVLGVPTLPYATMVALTTLYQFWIHTPLVKPLGRFEWLFNTPSQHRVHHAINPRFLDKNHGGTFSVWDRLFGTYQVEDERCVYGTTTPLGSYDPLWAQVEYFVKLGRMMRAAPSLGQALQVPFRSPAWKPAWWNEAEAPALDARPAFNPQVTAKVRRYVLVNLGLLSAATFALMLWGDPLPVALRVACVGAVLFGLWSLTRLYEGKGGKGLEYGRLGYSLAVGVALVVLTR